MVKIRFPERKEANRGGSSSESRSTEERRKHSTSLRRSTGLPLVVTSAALNKPSDSILLSLAMVDQSKSFFRQRKRRTEPRSFV